MCIYLICNLLCLCIFLNDYCFIEHQFNVNFYFKVPIEKQTITSQLVGSNKI